jgi:fluoride exporter
VTILRLMMWVAVGSAMGGSVRFLMGVVGDAFGRGALTTTMVVNAIGSSLCAVLIARLPIDGDVARALWVTGFCGGLTTYSAFNQQVLTALRQQQWSLALSWWLAMGVVCIAAAAVTLWLMTKLGRP